MKLSDAVIIALLVAFPLVLAQVAAIIMAIKADSRSDKKLDHIVLLTNGTLHEAKQKIKELELVVIRLKKKILPEDTDDAG